MATEDLDQKRMMIEKEREKKQREASEDDTIQVLAHKKLKHFLKSKIELLKQNPNELLQKHQMVDDNAGKPYVNSVLIKLHASEIQGSDSNEMDLENNYFMHTFRISKHTHLTQLKKAACDFWGVNDKEFEFYEDSGKKYSNEEGNS